MQNPVTTPALTEKTVSVNLPCHVPMKVVQRYSSIHSSSGLTTVRRDKTAPDPVELVSLVATTRLRDQSSSKLQMMPWRCCPNDDGQIFRHCRHRFIFGSDSVTGQTSQGPALLHMRRNRSRRNRSLCTCLSSTGDNTRLPEQPAA